MPESGNERAGRSDPEEGRWVQRDNIVITVLAIAFAAFHFYTGIFGVFVPTLQRTIHLLFAVVLEVRLQRPRLNRRREGESATKKEVLEHSATAHQTSSVKSA